MHGGTLCWNLSGKKHTHTHRRLLSSPLLWVGLWLVFPFISSAFFLIWVETRCDHSVTALNCRIPGAQVTPQFKHSQSERFHFLVSSPSHHLTVRPSVCRPSI